MPKVILDWDTRYSKGIITSDFLNNIRHYFSVPNPLAKLSKFQGSHIPKRLFAITDTGRFNIGLYYDIHDYLINCDIDYDVITTPLLKDKIETGYTPEPVDVPVLNLPYRDFQEQGILEGLKYGKGIFVIGTAGGKTLLMAGLISAIKPTTTFVLLPPNLIEQTYNDLIEYGIPKENISQWSGDHEFKKAPIILATYPIVQARINQYCRKDGKIVKSKRKKDSEWKQQRDEYLTELSDVDLVIIDEVHTLKKANLINETVDIFKTPHKFGLTGTLPESLIDTWNIIGKIGPIILDVNSAELQKSGAISPVFAQVINIKYKHPPHIKRDADDPTKGYLQECAFIYNSEYRNKIISRLAQKVDNNILIMVDKLDHGELLEKTLQTNIPNKEVYFIRGSVEMNDRESVKKLMEAKNNIVCIAMTKIFSTGISVKNIHYLLFAQSGKAKITLLQSIGRGLRLHPKKNLLVIFDIADELYYGRKHLEVRVRHYDNEKIKYETKTVCET